MNSTSFWGDILGLGKRLITERQEQILRLCHHDYEGLTQDEAAKRLGVTRPVITRALAQAEKVAPQLFPILTKLEAKCYHYYMTEGWSVSGIAQYLGQSENAIYKTLQRARDKGMYFNEAKGRMLSYDPNMDGNVEQKF